MAGPVWLRRTAKKGKRDHPGGLDWVRRIKREETGDRLKGREITAETLQRKRTIWFRRIFLLPHQVKTISHNAGIVSYIVFRLVSLPGVHLQCRGRSRVPKLWWKGQGAGRQWAQLQEGFEEVWPAVSVLPRAASGQQGPAEEVPDDRAGAGGEEEGVHLKY